MARELVWEQQPSTAERGRAIEPAPRVAIYKDGALEAINGADISVELAAGDGVLAGALTQKTVGGVASFPNLHLSKYGSGFKLRALCDDAQPVFAPRPTRYTYTVASGSAESAAPIGGVFAVSRFGYTPSNNNNDSREYYTVARVVAKTATTLTLEDAPDLVGTPDRYFPAQWQVPAWTTGVWCLMFQNPGYGWSPGDMTSTGATSFRVAADAPGIDAASAWALWRLNEVTTLYKDSAGSLDLSGTINGTTTGPTGTQALKFAGTVIRSIPLYDANQAAHALVMDGEYQIAALVRAEKPSSEGTILAVQGAPPSVPARCIAKLVIGSDGVPFAWHENVGSSFPKGSTAIATGATPESWSFVGVRCSGGKGAIFVNGEWGPETVIGCLGASNVSAATGSYVQVGGQAGLSRNLRGEIDEVWFGPPQDPSWMLEQARRCGVAA